MTTTETTEDTPALDELFDALSKAESSARDAEQDARKERDIAARARKDIKARLAIHPELIPESGQQVSYDAVYGTITLHQSGHTAEHVHIGFCQRMDRAAMRGK